MGGSDLIHLVSFFLSGYISIPYLFVCLFVCNGIAAQCLASTRSQSRNLLPRTPKPPVPCHAYMSSHSSSSSSPSPRGGGGIGGGGFFSCTRSFRSSGHVACSFSQGAMHSRSNRWFLLQGKRTTRGYSSVSGGLVRWFFLGLYREKGGNWVWKGHEGGLGIEGDWGLRGIGVMGLEIYRLGRDCCRWGSPWTV